MVLHEADGKSVTVSLGADEPDGATRVVRQRSQNRMETFSIRPADSDQVSGATPPATVRHPFVASSSGPATVRDKLATVVLPAPGSRAARRTRGLRAWNLSLPVDIITLLAPLVWRWDSWKGMACFAALTIVLFATGGLYRGRRHLSILDELPSLVGRLLTAAAIVAIIVAERHDSSEYVSRFMQTVALSCGLILFGRTLTRKVVLVARRKRWVEHGAVIIGGGPVAEELARLIRRYPQYGLRFAGFIDDEAGAHWPAELAPWIGSLSSIETVIEKADADVIIVADGTYSESQVMELIRTPACMARDLWVVPRLHDFQSTGGQSDHIGAIPVMRIKRPTITGPKYLTKRAFDLTFATLALLVLSPIMALCAVAVWCEGGRHILFRQERIGHNGRSFNLIKFRSMKPVDEHESRTNWSVAEDMRVGPVGRVLRRTSLDELPQLWNILRGDMTFVGPRPERPYFVEQFANEHRGYSLRHRVPVGLTGLAQVSGLRGDTPISDRARFDNYYIENWSLWLDLKVLIRTVGEVLRAGGR
jgi:exopolysaccharide biosynthesis polyprenyl glycosylphosphotransferase